MEDRGVQVRAVHQHQRARWDRAVQRLGILSLVGLVGAEAGRRQQVRAQRHHRHDLHQRVAADPAVLAIAVGTRRLASEVRAILLAVGHANRRAIDAVQRQPAPSIPICTGIGPLRRRALVQPLHRVGAQPCTCLADGARRHSSPAIPARHREVKLPNHLGDGPVTEQGHPDDEPYHLLRRQPSLAYRRRAGRRKRLFDPQRIEMPSKGRVDTRSQRGRVRQRFRETHVEIAHDRRRMILRTGRNQVSGHLPEFRSNLRNLALTDRHCC